jgi:hypothetical protein
MGAISDTQEAAAAFLATASPEAAGPSDWRASFAAADALHGALIPFAERENNIRDLDHQLSLLNQMTFDALYEGGDSDAATHERATVYELTWSRILNSHIHDENEKRAWLAPDKPAPRPPMAQWSEAVPTAA